MTEEGEGPAPRPSRPLVLPEIFSGEGNFDDWVSHFESVAAVNKWTDEDKILWLRVRLTGKAHVAYTRLGNEVQQSYSRSKAELRDRFEPSSKKELYKVQFECRKKSNTENWADFADDLLVLVDKAFPDLQIEAKEQLALSRFFDQLESPQISFAVKQRKPRSVREAVSATMEFESYLPKEAVRQVKQQPAATTVSNEQGIQREILVALQQVQSRLEKLETASTNATQWKAEQRPPRQVSDRARDQVVICRRCKQPGHYARGCAFRRNQGDNDIEQNAPVTSINNITSYFVCARVLGAPVSFLVDTGAGVSLLSVSIWDKCESSEIKLEPGMYQNLVGVDGHPIRVRGSVTIPVSIAGRSFQQQFIIADHITAEGILGIDFMERNNCVVDLAKRQMTVEKCITVPLASNAPCCNMNAMVNNVVIKETTIIPAESEVEMMVQLSSGSGTYLMEGNQLKLNGVLVARAIVTPKDNAVPMRIANTSALPVTVFKGMKIGKAELIEEVNINAIETSSLNETPQWPNQDGDGLQLSLPEELTEVQRDKFVALLSQYSDVVATNNEELGRTSILSHKIDTGDATPIRQQARRVPLPHREKVQELLKDMMEKKVISPSKSPWASPVVLVTKKDGSTRFCIDYRKVNEVTRKDAYPIPRVDDTLDTLAGSTWFSTLDLKSGYWQVEVAEEHREKTAFCTQEGLFEFNVMPFGLCNAPATFQRLMNAVLAGLQWTSCLVYIDDIIVVGSTFDLHLCNLQKVFERLKQAGLKLQPQKCHFFQRQVQFLGHIISQDGISPDPEKTSKVAQWPVPTSAVEVHATISGPSKLL